MCATKLCVWERCVQQNFVWKRCVCDRFGVKELCVTKNCVWQNFVPKIVWQICADWIQIPKQKHHTKTWGKFLQIEFAFHQHLSVPKVSCAVHASFKIPKHGTIARGLARGKHEETTFKRTRAWTRVRPQIHRNLMPEKTATNWNGLLWSLSSCNRPTLTREPYYCWNGVLATKTVLLLISNRNIIAVGWALVAANNQQYCPIVTINYSSNIGKTNWTFYIFII